MYEAKRFVWALVPNVYAAVIALAALLASGTAGFIAYIWVFEAGNPVTEDSIVETRPADLFVRRVGRETTYLGLTRRICSGRTAQAEVISNWTEHVPRASGASGNAPPVELQRPATDAVVVFSSQVTTIRAGCHNYAVETLVPQSLPPNIYTYEANLRFCNSPFPCALYRMQELHISVAGGPWLASDPPMPPEQPRPVTSAR